MSFDFRPREPSAPAQPQTSTKAVISLVLGVGAFFFCLLGLPAAILGALALSDINHRPQHVKGKGLAIAGLVTGIGGPVVLFLLMTLMLPAMSRLRDTAQRVHTSNIVKMQVLAMHMFESRNRMLPDDIREGAGPQAAMPVPASATPLLSWRVRLLPYLEQESLYREFKLDQPWDSPHNIKLVERMPDCYKSLSAQVAPGKTVFLRPKGKEMVLGAVVNGQPFNGWNLGGICDGTSNTILIVEAEPEKAVIWTKPDDLDVDLRDPRRGVGQDRNGFVAGFGDATAREIKPTVKDATVGQLFTPCGQQWGQPVTVDFP